MARWWGPRGFAAARRTVHVEPWVGGRYDLAMVQAADGAMFWVRNRILELVEPELLVLESDPMPEHGVPRPIVTRVELEDDRGRTRLTLSRPYPPERIAGARAGWNGALDKLEALLRA